MVGRVGSSRWSIACVRTSFPFVVEYSDVRIGHDLFICSCTDGHLGCSHLLAVVYDAAVSMGVCGPI